MRQQLISDQSRFDSRSTVVAANLKLPDTSAPQRDIGQLSATCTRFAHALVLEFLLLSTWDKIQRIAMPLSGTHEAAVPRIHTQKTWTEPDTHARCRAKAPIPYWWPITFALIRPGFKKGLSSVLLLG